MKIAKFQADEEGYIHIPKCVAALWVGMQKDVPTIVCIVAESNEMGNDLSFYVKQPGDQVSLDEMTSKLATALVTADAEFILFGERPKIITPGSFPMPGTPPPNMGRGPMGGPAGPTSPPPAFTR